MTTSIYEGLESDVVESKDKKERAELRKELGDAVRRHLADATFWDNCQTAKAKRAYIAGKSGEWVLHVYGSIFFLMETIGKSHQRGGRAKRGFARWCGRLAMRLGSQSCNRLGFRICKRAGFTVEKAEKILAAMESKRHKASKEANKEECKQGRKGWLC